MYRSFPRLILFLLTLSWFSSTTLPALSEGEVGDRVLFTPPREAIQRPKLNGSGGLRCPCVHYNDRFPPLAALVPELERTTTQSSSDPGAFLAVNMSPLKGRGRTMPGQNIPRGGLTSQEFPSLFVYVPKANTTKGAVLLVEHLPNGEFEERHYDEFPLPEEPGIIRIPSPIALEEGKTYEWFLILVCDDESSNGDAAAAVTIKRVSLPDRLQSRLDRASLTAQLEIYGEAGLWYDFFELLTQVKQRSPQFQETWATILQNELEQDREVLQASLLPCCSTVARVQSMNENPPFSDSSILEKYGLR